MVDSIKRRGAYYSSHSKRCGDYLTGGAYSTAVLISKTGKNTVLLNILNEVGNAGRVKF